MCACDEVGTLRGTVVDEEKKPVEAADVRLRQRAQHSTLTDAGGAFVLRDVPVGTYTMLVSKPGYRNLTRDVGVTAGASVDVRLELEAVPLAVARTESFPLQAYMQLGASTPLNTFRPGQSLNDKVDFVHDVKVGAKSIISTMVWQSSAPLTAKKMRLDVVIDDAIRNQTAGKSPLRNVVEDRDPKRGHLDLVREPTKMGHHVWIPLTCDVNTPSECTQEPPSGLLVVVYDQRLDLYVTVFYDHGAPPGFTGVPG